MSKTASFGRRGGAASRPAPPPRTANGPTDIALTPEQRALLFDAPKASDSVDLAAPARAPRARRAGTVATFAIAAIVVALSFRMPRGGDALTTAEMAESILSIGANLGVSLWLTRMICARRKWSSLAALFLVGAAISGVFAVASAALGFGDGAISPAVAALAGGGAAALYRLVAGRRSFQ
ncbi:hypothetical protein K9U39_13320 [Rhodoblastus acidophilus]|uniref:Uncharacterized protein n=1 Tax=Candidatus Rhodoblastus alkanivorans TaxID=2954117 RepID=A0ABS9ZAU0_9HYPH|nr:hypothetical protein [Candidatus Rhodoblastus alkanivorans]MCI4677238.1 hypothetical protein [Candidatus Rhodoblastus alkanivorans]MCI4684590.1 hypothetical protein [Candidatus Rhodoblastus alkanivorans]MDI4641912.1 hypothetical protein [Rhodoblastus acidophilus]